MVGNMGIKRLLFFILALLLTLMILSGCVPGDGQASITNPSGFLSGVWHGWIAPVTLIIGFFNSNIRIYEIYNTGHWYDIGFYIAILGGFGGFALTRKRKKVEKHEHHYH